MNTKTWGLIIVVLLAIAAIFWYTRGTAAAPATSSEGTGTTLTTLGSYPYECDEHVTFTMTPSGDMGSIAIAPTVAGATYPPAVTLIKATASSGVRYEGGGVIFTAKGETVTLGEGDSAINCSPVPNQESAPFNFGD